MEFVSTTLNKINWNNSVQRQVWSKYKSVFVASYSKTERQV